MLIYKNTDYLGLPVGGDREQQKEQTFWHEVIHGILNYRSIDISKAELETLVDSIASELYAIMQTNPCLPGQGQQDKR